jgi:hypothetical protein
VNSNAGLGGRKVFLLVIMDWSDQASLGLFSRGALKASRLKPLDFAPREHNALSGKLGAARPSGVFLSIRAFGWTVSAMVRTPRVLPRSIVASGCWKPGLRPTALAASGVMFWLHAIRFIPKAFPTRATCDVIRPSPKDRLFEQADILTIHLVLSSRTRGLVGAAEWERMKPTALLIQYITRADRRRAGFDQRVEEQANRRCNDRRIRH